MKVFEKYIDDITDFIVFSECDKTNCLECTLHNNHIDCYSFDSIKDFLLSEYHEPIELSEDERAIE